MKKLFFLVRLRLICAHTITLFYRQGNNWGKCSCTSAVIHIPLFNRLLPTLPSTSPYLSFLTWNTLIHTHTYFVLRTVSNTLFYHNYYVSIYAILSLVCVLSANGCVQLTLAQKTKLPQCPITMVKPNIVTYCYNLLLVESFECLKSDTKRCMENKQQNNVEAFFFFFIIVNFSKCWKRAFLNTLCLSLCDLKSWVFKSIFSTKFCTFKKTSQVVWAAVWKYHNNNIVDEQLSILLWIWMEWICSSTLLQQFWIPYNQVSRVHYCVKKLKLWNLLRPTFRVH